MKAHAPVLFCFLLLASVSASAQTTRIASVRANDLVYDPVHEKLYASVPGSAGANGNSIAVIDPASGAVETYVWVGSEPNQLAVSDDGEYLYVGLDGAYAIRRFHLGTLTPGLQFGLGASSNYSRYVARDIAVVPGDPTSVAVVRGFAAGGSTNVAIFTDGVIRPISTADSYEYPILAFGSAERLYASIESYYRELVSMYVTPAGVTVADRSRSAFSNSGAGVRFSQGRLYGAGGSVIDPETRERVATLPTMSSSESLTDVAVDAPAGMAYAIVSRSGAHSLRAYDLATWRPRWTTAVAGTLWGTWRSLVTAGESRLAFRTTSADFPEVVIVDLAATSALTVSKRGSGNGIVTSTPGGIECGVACAALFPATSSVTLTAAPTTGAAFVRWDGDTDCADGVVSMSAAKTCTAVFAQTTIGPSIELPLSVNDLAYSPATGLIYASVPGRDPAFGNTVTAIDPVSGAMGPSVWVGSEPNKLAVSIDGGMLYVGLDGAAAVRQVDLATLAPGSPFQLGRHSDRGPWRAAAMAVSPQDAGTVAVVRRSTDTSSDDGVGIYTGGAARPLVSAGLYPGTRGLTFSAVGTRLYGGNGQGALRRMSVDSAGVVVLDSLQDVWEGSGVRFGGGRLFSDRGRVVDAEAMAINGTFPLSAASGSAVCPDTSRGVVYFLERPSSSSLYLRIYDAERFTRRLSIALSGANGTVSSFIATGPGRLAFRTDTGQLFLLSHVGVVAARPSRDFDGDVQADVAVFRPSTGTWFTLHSSTDNSTFGTRGWGVQAEGDTPVTGDFDGDGLLDPTVYRPAAGTWFILESHANYTTWQWFGWGTATDTPMPGDYDGDGKTDGAVYRASTGTWYVRPSSGAAPWSVVFGEIGDVPLTGDFDGDGRTDPTVYRASMGTWFWLKSSSGFAELDSRGWGVDAEGDLPVPGDYDGDGKTDPCVYRPATGTWFVLESNAAYSTWSWFGWGASGDTPTPADFDGDGKTDGAVYRASTGTWYVRPSSGLAPWSVVFGAAGDVPLLTIR